MSELSGDEVGHGDEVFDAAIAGSMSFRVERGEGRGGQMSERPRDEVSHCD